MDNSQSTNPPHYNVSNTQSGLRIPLAKADHCIAMAFASEQKDVKKGKQIFLNTLSTIAVHECLKIFGFESYLQSGDLWNKTKRSLFNVADLLIQDFGRIECLPIVPKQKLVELEPGIFEYRRGSVGVKFYEHFNFVEMLGFISSEEVRKLTLTNSLTLQTNGFNPFEDIFNHLKYCQPSIIGQGIDWKKRSKRFEFADNLDNRFSEKSETTYTEIKINDFELIIEASMTNKYDNYTKAKFTIYNNPLYKNLPHNLTLTIFKNGEITEEINQTIIGGDHNYEIKFLKFKLGTNLTFIFSINEIQVAHRFIFDHS